jgi:DNA-directed RNA polymerase specialized sigma24 family protein
MENTELEKNNRLLMASLALQAAGYKGEVRIEYVLAEQGLNYQEIAQILGKKPDAVRMLLKRRKQEKNI